MAGFIEEILSGKYPNLKDIWEKKLGSLVDEAFETLTTLKDPEAVDSDEALKLQAAERQIALLKADKTELEYRLNVVKAERDSLLRKLNTIRESLGAWKPDEPTWGAHGV